MRSIYLIFRFALFSDGTDANDDASSYNDETPISLTAATAVSTPIPHHEEYDFSSASEMSHHDNIVVNAEVYREINNSDGISGTSSFETGSMGAGLSMVDSRSTSMSNEDKSPSGLHLVEDNSVIADNDDGLLELVALEIECLKERN